MVYTGIHIHTQNWQCLMGNNDKYLWNRRNEGINIHCEHQLFHQDAFLRFPLASVHESRMMGSSCAEYEGHDLPSAESTKKYLGRFAVGISISDLGPGACQKMTHTHTHIPHPEATSSPANKVLKP